MDGVISVPWYQACTTVPDLVFVCLFRQGQPSIWFCDQRAAIGSDCGEMSRWWCFRGLLLRSGMFLSDHCWSLCCTLSDGKHKTKYTGSIQVWLVSYPMSEVVGVRIFFLYVDGMIGTSATHCDGKHKHNILDVRRPLSIVSWARYSAVGADNVKEHLTGVPYNTEESTPPLDNTPPTHEHTRWYIFCFAFRPSVLSPVHGAYHSGIC